MRSSVCPALTTAAIVHGLSTDHDRRRGQRCTVLTHPVSPIHRGIFVQMNRATSVWLRTCPTSQQKFMVRSKRSAATTSQAQG